MSQTREALVNRALQNLGAKPAGLAAAAEDYKIADDALEPMLASLASRDVWQWGDPDVIDDDAFLILADLLANEVARDFGATRDENARLLGERRLRELAPHVLSGQPQQVEYF